jgi:P4 family phage/plasmid primase-like protien
VEEFLDMQMQDAMDEVARAEDALEAAGVPRAVINAGVRELQKEADEKQMPLVFMLMGAQTYLKFVQKRRDYKYIVSAANTAKPMIAISVCDLDRNEFFINTPVATFDLRKGLAGELPHDPGDLITKITACSPGDEGKQLWLDALELFFCKDQSLIDYVQETVGMAAIGKVYQEHMIIAYGGGANGKSTFWNTIFRVLGNYAGKLSAEALTMSCKRNVKPEMAELKGKRLIISSEMEEGMRLNTAVVKQLCSTDEIQAEKKYKDPFSFVPSHTLVLYTNHLPKVGANDDGIWRRLIVIPFNAKIAGKSDIKNYADFLFEHAGPAIMSWIIEGAQKAIAKEFHTKLPQVVKDAIQAYREDNDWLGQFLEECCEVDPSYKEKSGEIYQAYRAYCIQNGEYIRSTSDFYSSMDKAGYNRIRKNTGVQVVGLRLKEGQDFLE